MTEMGNDKETRQDDIYSRIYRALSDIKNSSCYQQTQYYVKTYPMLAVAAITIGSLSFLPVLTFTFFVLATFMVSLLWFLFVEGTILTVAIVILSGILFTIGILSAALTVCVGVSWFIVRKIHSIACSRQHLFCFSNQYYTDKTCVKQEIETIPVINSTCDSIKNVNGSA